MIIKNNICLSGGADGADLLFGEYALKNDHSLIHWSFSTHYPKLQKEYVVKINSEELIEADPLLIETNKFLNRKFPTSSNHINNLLRRSFFQIIDTQTVYAVSSIKNNVVNGGTAWAIYMYLVLHDFKDCPVYVFCQISNQWFTWDGIWKQTNDIPQPKNVYTGIGTRKLENNGIYAIKSLYGD